MSEICIDASAAVKLVLLRERLRSHARQIFADAAIADRTVIAPQLFIYEIDSIIRASEQSGSLSARDAKQAYADLDELDIAISIRLMSDGAHARSPAGLVNNEYMIPPMLL